MVKIKVCDRRWVERESEAFTALIQQHYLVVPKTARGRWVQMQKMIDVDDHSESDDDYELPMTYDDWKRLAEED